MTSELSLAEGGGLLDLGVEQLLYLHHTTNLSFNASTLQHLCGLASNQSEVGEVCGAWHESGPPIPEYVMTIIQIFYALVCLLGLLGNSLVIYVVLRFSKMHTVTNTYILHLAMADECFLVGIPFLSVTMFLGEWPFGTTMCKIYFTTTSINQITSSLFLMVLSADRYIAVCHPISSPRFRTGVISKVVSLSAWLVSAILMLPIFLYATTITRPDGGETCMVVWTGLLPGGDLVTEQTAFTLYSLLVGFLGPLALILTFYLLVLGRMRRLGPRAGGGRSQGRHRAARKVTRLVLTVITVYVVCWLPHCAAQLAVALRPPGAPPSPGLVTLVLLANCLQYSNSALNPLLYAGLSDNFRKSFRKACHCGLFWRDPNPQPRDYSFTTRRTMRGPRFTGVLTEEPSSQRPGPDPSTASLRIGSSVSLDRPPRPAQSAPTLNGLLAPPAAVL